MEFFLLLFLIFIGVTALIGFLIYFIPKKLGYPKTAKWLIWIYVLFVAIFAFTTIFEDKLFTKNDAKKLIAEQGIKLSDEFELVENKSMSAIGDYYHTFTVSISHNDKEKVIQLIRSNPYFKKTGEAVQDYRFGDLINKYEGKEEIQNYETENAFVRELFRPNGKGYAPTFRRITISKTENTLIFEDIDD